MRLAYYLILALAVTGHSFLKTADYVTTGQLFGTPRHNFPDRINGKVYEVYYRAFWPEEEKGKIVLGNHIKSNERSTLSLSQDFMEQYNTSGTITRFESYNDEGQVTLYWKVETEGKKIIRAECFNLNHLRTMFTVNSYTGNNLAEVKSFRVESGPVSVRINYDYDQNGNRTRFQTFTTNILPGNYTEFSYNRNGDMEQAKVYSPSGNLISTFNYGFNRKGEKIFSRSEDLQKGTVTVFNLEHECDKMGNWIKEILFKDDKPYYIRTREIKYYD